MTWYAAHIILWVKFKGRGQDHFPVWENIVLIEAESEAEAFTKAEVHGRAQEGDEDGHFRWDGKPARWVFAGVRKLTECVFPEERPGDGTEVTYSQLDLKSEADVNALAAGKPVRLRYDDPYRPKSGVKSDAG
jgi:Domain of unknown function (DUF4288)